MNPDPWVDAYLRDRERAVDAGRLLDGVRARLARPGPGPARKPRRVAWRAAAVAATALALICGWALRPNATRVEAAQLVRDARAALAAGPPDRSYRIAIRLAPGAAEHAPYLAGLATFDCRLWARPDRFRVEGRRGDVAWAAGRDERRRVWLAPDPRAGVEFEAEEIPEALDAALDLFHLDLDALLGLLAGDFDVVEAPPDPDLGGATTLVGTPRPDRPRPRLGSIRVAIDGGSKAVRRVTLGRLRYGRPVADVSFTFERAGDQPDSAYRLAGHLRPDAPTLGPDDRPRRRRALARFFGSLLPPG